MRITRALLAALCLVLSARADEAKPVEAAGSDAPESSEKKEEEEPSETQNILNELTIHMGGEILDERTFLIRDTVNGGKKKIRLGNVAPIEKGSMSDEEYNEKVEAGKNALTQFVDKQMIFWKEAPEAAQPARAEGEPEEKIPLVISDVWTIDGRHINGILHKAGHVVKTEDYQSEFAKDILTAAADDGKRDQYKKLEEALKENEAYKKQQKKAQQEEEEEAEDVEHFGFAGWLGMGVFGILVLGALTNFGRAPKEKRVNLNKKKNGFFAGLFSKLKGN